MVRLTIDGRHVSVPEGTSVLEAALAHGIDIPRLCHHPELVPTGACRLCLVEVEGGRGPAPSCGLQVTEGMMVTTRSDRLTRLRREVLDLLLSDHPLRCVVCEKSGACELQRYAYEFGLAESSHPVEVARDLYQDDNPFFVRDHQYCVLCARCVRVCDEVVGASAIEIAGRGFDAHVASPFDGPLVDSDCVFCGNCVQVCPTAALMPVSRLGKGREWEYERTRTVCGYCGVGCGLEILTRDGRVVYVRGYPEAPANGEFLCVKGRFGWDFLHHPDRLTRPLVRRDVACAAGLVAEPPPETPERSVLVGRGRSRDWFIEVDWDVALDLVADRLAAVVTEHGADAVAGLCSAKCTNEENYLFQKLMRGVVGTNNVDHCARFCHSPSVAGLAAAFGSGAMTNSIREIRDADCVLVAGSNTSEAHPVIAYEVVRAARRGASVIVVDPRRIPLVDHSSLHLQPAPGQDLPVFLAMVRAILAEGWADEAFIDSRTEGLADLRASVEPWTAEAAALVSGVPAEDILRAARIYALGLRRDQVDGPAPGTRGNSTVLYAMGITQRAHGTDAVKTLANLVMVAGQIGRPATGLNPLRGQCNVQGACDMGGLPNVLPGYRPVTDAEARRRALEAWFGEAAGRPADLPDRPGLTVVEMTEAARSGRVRAMVIMGENPMLMDPDLGHVEEGLRALDFLVVQDLFLTETAQLAHVVLPAAAFAEKDGTFTNTERRVQSLRKALDPPGQAKPDWWVLCRIGERLGERLGRRTRWDYSGTAEVFRELAGVTPTYAGIRHERLGLEGIQWPCPSPEHPGTPILHRDRFTRGLGRFHAVGYRPPVERPDAEYPLVLTTGRSLFHYHAGSMSRRSEPLDWREPRAYAEVHAADAERAGIRDGGVCLLTSRRGSIRVQARVGDRVPEGVVFVSFHFREAPANLLTHALELDPEARMPELKVCAVRLESLRPARERAG